MISRIPGEILNAVQEVLKLPNLTSIKNFSFSGGGCINHGGELETAEGSFFLKWNDEKKFPGMFEAESKGLRLLKQQKVIRIPSVIGFGVRPPYQFLLLELIEQKFRSKNYWEQLGLRLVSLHRCSSEFFGLDHDNYIGSLPQYNHSSASWISFFVEQRLDIQLRKAIESGAAPANWARKFEELYNKLPSLLPVEKPSLLHGDLWSGNLLTDDQGEPCLIDPAVYYGNREADLAMTRLFGGFNAAFYSTYEENFSLPPGYNKRVDLYNLYPLLVHVNLFGGSYMHSVERILRNFS